MGVQDLNFGFVQHVAHALLWSSGGRGDVNILEEYYTWPMELLAVVNMLHMFAYGHQVGAYSWTWRHNVALIRLVGVCGHGVAERQIPQIPAFCLLASKISISNLSPLQGWRVNRLPCCSSHSWQVKHEEGYSIECTL